ncbi:uncharacterized protein LOC114299499 [Camellia sinensis]|uniref:uncharacterized protein LOC114299499 n=1 Tax=Camellia sinensis TaxID=4442 RepID=UPI00103697D0|nr:uncharacterized protein LOC114299499 [Camellia sinensis]
MIKKIEHMREVLSVQPTFKRGKAKEKNGISFSDRDLARLQNTYNDALVITLHVKDFNIKRILIDQSSSFEIMYYDAFKQLKLMTKTFHLLRLLWLPRDLFMIEELEDIEMFENVGKEGGQKAVEGLVEVGVDENDLEKFFLHGSSMSSSEMNEIIEFLISSIELFSWMSYNVPGIDPNQELISFLLGNPDVFAWSPYEMSGVDPSVSQYRLNVDPKCKSIIQKSWQSAMEHTAAVVEEVDRFLDAGTIREVTYPTWLSNTIVVKKKKWNLAFLCGFRGLQQSFSQGLLSSA